MEVQSPFTITFDELPGNLTFSEYLLDNRFPFFGKALALIDAESGRRWKYSELRGWVKHVLKNMEKEYISSNARIGVIAKNCPEMLILDVACGLIGITCTAMNPQGSIDELWHQVDLCDATNIITQGAFLSKAEEIKKKAQARGGGRLRNIHLFDAIVFQPGPEFEENGNPGPIVVSKRNASKNSPATSTAATPRASLKPVASGTRLNASSKFHQPPRRSKSNLNLPHVGKLDSKSYLHLDNSISPSSSIQELGDIDPLSSQPEAIRGSAFSSTFLIFFSSGTTGLPKPVEITHRTFIRNVQQMRSIFAPSAVHLCPPAPKDRVLCQVPLHHVYGTLVAFYALYNGSTAVTMSKSGKLDLLLQTIQDFKIVHPDKRHLLGPEQPGEMCVKGPQITPKYYKNMKATAELFDKDGFLKTGDLGYYDATGALYMVDRLKDAIKTKGSLVYPTEVENTLRSHPGIADIAVIGRPEASGEVPAAFIVREKGHPNLAAAEIRNFAKGKLAGFKELKGGIFFVQEIPRSATGKIMRRQLKGFWDRKDSNTGGSGNTTQTDRRGSMSQTNPDASPASRKSSAASQKVLSTKGNLVKK